MFRRRWSGLPKDPVFPSTLEALGYFVNDEDEIRNIEEPGCYFRYFLDKNERINNRQRFQFNGAIRDIVHRRLQDEGLNKVHLPIGTDDASRPHVPIFASANLQDKSRIVVIFGEPNQDLGNLALRVANGSGGIDKGTMVSVVRQLKQQASSASDTSPPGVILGNVGELCWWPEGQRPLTLNAMPDMPLASMVHYGRRCTALNTIPENETAEMHIHHVLEKILPSLAKEDALIDLIGIGLGADSLEKYLDEDCVWARFGNRINTLSILGGVTPASGLNCSGFKAFLAKRGRAYVLSEEVVGTPLAGPHGNPKTSTFTEHGTAAVLSSGEPYHTECIMIQALDAILGWTEEVALVGHEIYRHPEITVVHPDPHLEEKEENASAWADFDTAWNDVPDEVKPSMTYVDLGVKSQDAKGGALEAGVPGEEVVHPATAEEADKERKIQEAFQRFQEKGYLMDPREVEAIEAEVADREDAF